MYTFSHTHNQNSHITIILSYHLHVCHKYVAHMFGHSRNPMSHQNRFNRGQSKVESLEGYQGSLKTHRTVITNHVVIKIV